MNLKQLILPVKFYYTRIWNIVFKNFQVYLEIFNLIRHINVALSGLWVI